MDSKIKSILSLIVALFIATGTSAQTVSIPDTLNGWEQQWVASLNGSQAAYSNWSQGGVSSVSGTGSSVFTLLFRDGKFAYGFRTNLKYGQARINGDGVRKTDDLISIRNRFTYTFEEDGTLSAYGVIGFKPSLTEVLITMPKWPVVTLLSQISWRLVISMKELV